MNQVRAEKVIKPLMAVVITGIFLGIYVMIPAFYSTLWQLTVSRDIQGLSAYIASFGSAAVLLMILLIVLTNMTGLPSVQFVTVNGILFGLLPGIVISWIGQVAGNVLAFAVMRYVFRRTARRLVARSRFIARLNRHITARTAFFLRAIPYSPNFAITALCALSRIGFTEHGIATIAGKFLAICIEVWMGYGLIRFDWHDLRLAAVAVLLMMIFMGYKWYVWKHKN
ncbi:VTT domain-containing protein [uncultured Megasphaera sp.]|uniref:TVP38/TMEM64 family protein n=1 Tax=uncultured Megasphaera sp. TaxID=165188 RepID=UPI00261E7EF6|nr:VTT domain-containing protein [uncultured Megasphaera sp.]